MGLFDRYPLDRAPGYGPAGLDGRAAPLILTPEAPARRGHLAPVRAGAVSSSLLFPDRDPSPTPWSDSRARR